MADELLKRIDGVVRLARAGVASRKVEVDAETLAELIRLGDAMRRALFAYFLMGFIAGAIAAGALALAIGAHGRPGTQRGPRRSPSAFIARKTSPKWGPSGDLTSPSPISTQLSSQQLA